MNIVAWFMMNSEPGKFQVFRGLFSGNFSPYLRVELISMLISYYIKWIAGFYDRMQIFQHHNL